MVAAVRPSACPGSGSKGAGVPLPEMTFEGVARQWVTESVASPTHRAAAAAEKCAPSATRMWPDVIQMRQSAFMRAGCC